MISLRLIRFSPVDKETHLVAIIAGIASFFLNGLLLSSASASSSFSVAVVSGLSWYVYKLFDGLEYDGSAVTGGSLMGLIAVLAMSCAFYLT